MWFEEWTDGVGSAEFYRVRPRLSLLVTRGMLETPALSALMVHFEKVVRDDSTMLFWDASELLGSSGLGDLVMRLLRTQDAHIGQICCYYDSPMVGVELSMMQMSYAKNISFYLNRGPWVDELKKAYEQVTGAMLRRRRNDSWSTSAAASYTALPSSSSSSTWSM